MSLGHEPSCQKGEDLRGWSVSTMQGSLEAMSSSQVEPHVHRPVLPMRIRWIWTVPAFRFCCGDVFDSLHEYRMAGSIVLATRLRAYLECFDVGRLHFRDRHVLVFYDSSSQICTKSAG